VVNSFSTNPQTREREAVVIPLPISMHAGQIIMMTKMFAEVDLGFYDFTGPKAVLTWKSPR